MSYEPYTGKKKQLNIRPSAVTNCGSDLFGISKESYLSPLSIDCKIFEMLRHFNAIIMLFQDFYRKNPFLTTVTAFFVKTFRYLTWR